MEATTVTVSFGKIGHEGQTQVKEFESNAEAQSYSEKQTRAKERKGYSAPKVSKRRKAAATPEPATPTTTPV